MKNCFILFCDMILPSTMIILGLVWSKSPVKKVNEASGYRTKRSMTSQEAWKAAQDIFARGCIRFGVFSVIVSVIIIEVGLNFMNQTITQITPILLGIQILFFITTYIPVEHGLKKLGY